jgi:hypothetical protein
MDNTLVQAIEAIKSGDKLRGQQLLVDYLKANPLDDMGWLWMAAALDDTDRKRYCLNRALEANPANQIASQGLARLDTPVEVPTLDTIAAPKAHDTAPSAPVHPPPAPPARPPVQSTAPEARKKTKRRSSPSLLVILVLGIVLMCMCILVLPRLLNDTPRSPAVGEPGATSRPTGTPTPNYDPIEARGACGWYVENALKSPSSAEFLYSTEEVFTIKDMPENYRLVRGAVDAQNSYGANIRTWYECIVYYDEVKKEWFLHDLTFDE